MYPVATYPRKRDELDSIILSTRHLHLRLHDGRLGLLMATEHILSLIVFESDVKREEPAAHVIVYRKDYPAMFDGKGWKLNDLEAFVGELLAQARPDEGNLMEKSARLTLYAKMRAYRRAAGKPQRRRREGMGEACLLLRCAALKQVIPCLDAETVKFFLLAAAHANEVGVAWAEQSTYRGMGYHPEKYGLHMESMVEAGLMRWIRRNYFNPVTRRKEPNQYQFNPELVYVRRALRAQAYGLSPNAFEGLKKRDEIRENPDRKVREKSDQDPVRESNQHQLTNTMNHHQRSNSGFESADSRGKSAQSGAPGEKKQDKNPDRNLRSTSDQAHSAQNSDAKSPRSAEPRQSTPPPTPSPDEQRYSLPLSDITAEALAHQVKAEAPTRLWQARQLVDTYGAAAVEWGLGELAAALRAGTVKKSPFGLMKTWLVKGMHTTGEQAKPEWWRGPFPAPATASSAPAGD